MKYRYIYKNRNTGKKVYTNEKLKEDKWELVMEVRDGKIKDSEVLKKRVVEKNGQGYLIIGNKAIPFDKVDEAGRPVVDVESETKTNPDGSKDTTIKVPALKIKSKKKVKGRDN